MRLSTRLEQLEAKARIPRRGEVWCETEGGDWERLGGAALVLTSAELHIRKETPGLVVLDFGLKR